MVVCPQHRHERFLVEHLKRAGVEVERSTELLDFAQEADRVRARLGNAGGEEACEAAYLAGLLRGGRGGDRAGERVNWFSTYRVHHRVADRFRQGRVFLLGDAPAGSPGSSA